MYDPMIKELFPDLKSIYNPKVFDSGEYVDSNYDGEMYSLPGGEKFDVQTVINCLNGKYNLSHTLSHYGESCFPSSNARRHFMYLQMLCSATFGSSHYTQRENLQAFLLAQTFFGSGILRYEGKEYSLEKDDVFLIDCRKEHEYFACSEEGWGYRFAHFDGSMMHGYYHQILSNGNIKFHFDNKSEFQNGFRKLYQMCKNDELDREIKTNLVLTEMITEILCCLPQYQTVHIPETIMRQCGYLQEHCCEKLILEELAKEFQLSKFHMSREFKKYTGKTMYGYITECRIAIAQRLLRYSDMPVCDIASHVGFEDHNGFYRTFRQKEDISPSAYRKNWQLL